MCGLNHSTVLRVMQLPTSSRSISGHFACRRTERASLSSAAISTLTLFSYKKLGTLIENIHIVKQAKAEHAKLQ